MGNRWGVEGWMITYGTHWGFLAILAELAYQDSC